MKSVLISIQPYWVFLIIAKVMGWDIPQEKTIEVRKNYPKDENWDKVTKIYCTKDKKSFSQIPKEYQPLMEQFLGKVIGEFVCDEIDTIMAVDTPCMSYFTVNDKMDMFFSDVSCLDIDDVGAYLGFNKTGYGWHISNLVIYDKPRELREFCKFGTCPCGAKHILHCTEDMSFCANRNLTRPPQSWLYIESEVEVE